jgi:O-antigen/teichoic acid export membrane protein
LWRLLYPGAFGLMAIVNAFAVGVAMFSDLGIGQSVIQNARGDDPTFLNTIWTIQIVRGLGMTALMCVAAVPIARFYGEPELSGLIVMVALGIALTAFNSTNIFTANRQIALRRLTLIEITCQVASLAVIIGWAYVTHSVWALAVGTLVAPAIRLVLSHKALPGIRNRLCWNRETVKSVSNFGRWIFLNSTLTFLASNSDRLIFGKLVTMQMLGIYSIAMVWASFPSAVAGSVEGAVLFPLLSRAHGAGNASGAFQKFRAPVLWGTGWLYACLAAGGPTLIRFLYDQRAIEAGLTVQLLVAGYWFTTLANMGDAAMLALGHPRWLVIGQAARLAGMAILMPIGAWLFGFPGAVLGLSASGLVRYGTALRGCARHGLRPLAQDVALTAGVALTAAAGLAARDLWRRVGLHPGNARLDAFAEGVCVFLIVSALWGAAFAIARRRRAT